MTLDLYFLSKCPCYNTRVLNHELFPPRIIQNTINSDVSIEIFCRLYALCFLSSLKLYSEAYHLKVNTIYRSSYGLAYFDGKNLECGRKWKQISFCNKTQLDYSLSTAVKYFCVGWPSIKTLLKASMVVVVVTLVHVSHGLVVYELNSVPVGRQSLHDHVGAFKGPKFNWDSDPIPQD